MMRMLPLALSLLLSAAGALAAQEPWRRPNSEVESLWPRWLPVTATNIGVDPNPLVSSQGQAEDLAVDGHGVVHMVGRGYRWDYSNPQQPQSKNIIWYANNSAAFRKINGFSDGYVVYEEGTTLVPPSTTSYTDAPPEIPRIAVTRDGRVSVLWKKGFYYQGLTNTLQIRSFTPGQGWQQGSTELFTTSGTNLQSISFGGLDAVYDGNDVLHVVIGKGFTLRNTSGTITSKIHYILKQDLAGGQGGSPSNWTTISEGTEIPSPPTDKSYPRYDGQAGPWISASGSAHHIAWTHELVTPVAKKELRLYTGSGHTMVVDSTQGWLVDDGASLATDSQSVAHLIWRNTADGLGYRKGTGANETITLGGRTLRGPGLAVSATGTVYVAWYDNADFPTWNPPMPGYRAGFSARGPLGGDWKHQFPLAAPAGSVTALGSFSLHIPRGSEAVHMFNPATGFGYTRMTEFNLGGQDAFTVFSAGANATANAVTGNLQVDLPLFSTRGAGFACSPSLVYNSLEEEPGPLSSGWSHSYALTLTMHGGIDPNSSPKRPYDTTVFTLRFGDGRRVVFKKADNENYWLAMDEFGYFAKLEYQDPKFLLTGKFGTEWRFTREGRLEEVLDPAQNTLTFQYGAGSETPSNDPLASLDSKVLEGMADSVNRETTFEYDSQNRIKTVRDPLQRAYVIAYTNDRLSSVAIPSTAQLQGLSWKAQYHSSTTSVGSGWQKRGLLSSLTTTGDSPYQFTYTGDGRVRRALGPSVSHIDAAGGTATGQGETLLTYIDKDGGQRSETRVKQRLLALVTVRFDRRRCLGLEIDPEGRPGIVRDFENPYRNLSSFKDERNVPTTYAYWALGTQSPSWVGDNLQSIVRSGGDDPNNPSSTTNASYTYTGGGLNRVSSVTTPSGITEYRYDGAGNLTAIIPPAIQGLASRETFEYGGPRGQISVAISGTTGRTTFEYGHVSGLVTGIRRPDGQSPETFDYDYLGNLIRHTPAGGGTTEMEYDEIGLLVFRRSPAAGGAQRTENYFYNTQLLPFRTEDNQGLLSENIYDAEGKLLSQKDASNIPVTYEYDLNGAVRRTTDKKGATSESTYDTWGRALETVRVVTSPSGSVTERTRFEYTEGGQIWKEIRVGEAGHPDRVTEFVYDVRNNLRQTIRPEGAVTVQDYDTEDRVTSSKRGHLVAGAFVALQETQYDYNERGQLYQETQIIPGQTVYRRHIYDADGRRLRTLKPPLDNFDQETIYDGRGRVKRVLASDGSILSEYAYDDRDQQVAVKRPHGDRPGLVTVLRKEYDEKGQVVAEEDSRGARRRFVYDERGRLTDRIDPDGTVTRTEYNVLDQVTGEKAAFLSVDETQTYYEYDENGNRTKVRVFNPAAGAYTAEYGFLYDSANRMVRMTYPAVTGLSGDALSEEWSYNEFGERISHRDRNGKVALYGYDRLGRTTSERHTSVSSLVLADITRTYDVLSNPLSVTDSVGGSSVVYQEPSGASGYDALGRLRWVRWGLLGGEYWSTEYEYDENSNRTARTERRQNVLMSQTSYAYDVYDRLESISRGAGGPHVTLEYDASWRRRRVWLGASSPGAKDGTARIEYGYDAEGRIDDVLTAKAGESLAHFMYHYDQKGRRSRVDLVHLGATIDYRYDLQGRLTGETWGGSNLTAGAALAFENATVGRAGGNESGDPKVPTGSISPVAEATPRTPPSALLATYIAEYRYDPAGNRLSKEIRAGAAAPKLVTYVYDAQNRLLSETEAGVTASYEYDANGNQILRTQGAVAETFQYDHQNRLAGYLKQSGATLQSQWIYGYAVTGQRLFKEDLATSRREWFAYDGEDVTEDLEQVGAAEPQRKRGYVQLLEIDAKLGRVDLDSAGTILSTHWYVPDALGSVHAVVNPQGQTENLSLTSAWGEALPAEVFAPIQGTSERYAFTQRETDSEYRGIYFRNRQYIPHIARFIEPDPPADRRARFHYSYGDNAPTFLKDPLGLGTTTIIDRATKTITFRVALWMYWKDGACGTGNRRHIETFFPVWEKHIEEFWNTMLSKYRVRTGPEGEYSFAFDLDVGSSFIPGTGTGYEGDTLPGFHQVEVFCGKGRDIVDSGPVRAKGVSAKVKFFTGMSNDSKAHEVGHLVGLADGYTDNYVTGKKTPKVIKSTIKTPLFDLGYTESWGETVMGPEITKALTLFQVDLMLYYHARPASSLWEAYGN